MAPQVRSLFLLLISSLEFTSAPKRSSLLSCALRYCCAVRSVTATAPLPPHHLNLDKMAGEQREEDMTPRGARSTAVPSYVRPG